MAEKNSLNSKPNTPMKSFTFLIAFVCSLTILQTNAQDSKTKKALPIIGTWQLLKGTVIDHKDTTVTHYTKDLSFIKIINNTHFAFLLHDVNKGADSTASFVAGGGAYNLSGNQYTEHLTYCSSRKAEGYDFTFTVTIKNDTLTQSGIETVGNVSKMNTEVYVRIGK